MKVYVVMFSFKGFDDDYSEIIGAYDSKEKAQKKLQEEMEDIRFNRGYYDNEFYYDNEDVSDNKYLAYKEFYGSERVEIIEKEVE